eukprot:TRINITY_DN6072_c0_g7_i2.p1 TRINITY_DN6072_c0_g7~~TRINITY_DN6072_c0_g7_i2.p1  ORF type:complete len:274 (+),score=74.77 TRINITY_DN6072_c0_g7_i2:139-960(+)
MEKKAYKVKFVEYEIANGHVEYTVKVVASKGNDTFHIRDRYSSMRSYWRSMYSRYGGSTPTTFPPKKWFGNTKAMFVRHRMEELEHFFNATLEDPELATSQITQDYFKRKKVHLRNLSDRGKDEEREAKKEQRKQSAAKGVTVYDKRWRQIVDGVTKEYIDICLGEEPIPPEEVKRRTMTYFDALIPTLGKTIYSTKILSLPKGKEESLNFDLIGSEEEFAEWVDKGMREMVRIVKNEKGYYTREEVLDVFEANSCVDMKTTNCMHVCVKHKM